MICCRNRCHHRLGCRLDREDDIIGVVIGVVVCIFIFVPYYRLIADIKITDDLTNANNVNHTNINRHYRITYRYGISFTRKFTCEVDNVNSKFENSNGCGKDHHPCEVNGSIDPWTLYVFASQYNSNDCIVVENISSAGFLFICTFLTLIVIILSFGYFLAWMCIYCCCPDMIFNPRRTRCCCSRHHHLAHLAQAHVRVHPYPPQQYLYQGNHHNIPAVPAVPIVAPIVARLRPYPQIQISIVSITEQSSQSQ